MNRVKKRNFTESELEILLSVTATGGGTGVGELSPFDLRVAALIGDTALTGVVGAHEGDTDHPQDKQGEGTDCSVGPGVSSVGPGVSSPGVSSVGPGVSSVPADSGFSTGSAARGASNSSANHPTGRVLNRAVLESQAEIVSAIVSQRHL
ncbi:unnamed protein product [Pleuronectes platessa]|uniref:Uncharacterized protein n=1 Tax=Pleuronectes platessa TaxID=8262 RepID=A0A9N7TUD7_PLEPL|nr:unnamed protein product [Pleuronectes platessa]